MRIRRNKKYEREVKASKRTDILHCPRCGTYVKRMLKWCPKCGFGREKKWGWNIPHQEDIIEGENHE